MNQNKTLSTMREIAALLEQASNLFGELPGQTQNDLIHMFTNEIPIDSALNNVNELISNEMRAFIGKADASRAYIEGDARERLIEFNALIHDRDDNDRAYLLKSNYIEQGLYLDLIMDEAIQSNDAEIADFIVKAYPNGIDTDSFEYTNGYSNSVTDWAREAAAYGAINVLQVLADSYNDIDYYMVAEQALTNKTLIKFEATPESDSQVFMLLHNKGVSLSDYHEDLVEKLDELGLDGEIEVLNNFIEQQYGQTLSP
jgi:hypothetical protein